MRQSKRRRESEFQANGIHSKPVLGMSLCNVEPKTFTQARVFKEFAADKHLTLHGVPGSGKTFLAMYLALDAVQAGEYEKIIVIRSAVPSRDQGFLPGNVKDKQAVYEAPYEAICKQLYGRDDAYSILKQKKWLEFGTTSYIRGVTIDDAVIILDEAQNCSWIELHTVITRLGNNSRLLVLGDEMQKDNMKETSGLHTFMNVLAKVKSFSQIEFTVEDVVRSGVVKEYLLALYNS